MVLASTLVRRSANPTSLVVLLHGWMGNRADLLALASTLPHHADALLVELPHHADADAATTTSDDDDEILLQIRHEIQRRCPVNGAICLLGYSLGGRLVLQLAQKLDNVSAAVLLSASPGIVDDKERGERRGRDAALAERLRGFSLCDDAHARFQTWLHDEWYALPMWGRMREHPAYLAMLIRRVHGARIGELASMMQRCSPGVQKPQWDWLRDPHIPVLYLAGEEDAAYASVACSLQRGRTGRSNLEVHIIPGAGHNLLMQAAAPTAERCSRFLQRVLPPMMQPQLSPRSASATPFRVASYRLQSFTIGLNKPLPVSKHASLTSREGALVFLTVASDQGGGGLHVGVGELCPLPGRHSEDIDEALAQLRAVASALVDLDISSDLAALGGRLGALLDGVCTGPMLPSVRAALEMALLHATARAQKRSVCDCLATQALHTDPSAPPLELQSHVRLNGLASLSEAANLAASDSPRTAMRTIKVKVGGDADADGARAGAILNWCASRGITLRLDANQAWTWDEAMAFGRALRQCAAAACEWLEYVEEPLVATESARSGEWSTLTGLPFALDESVENLTRESLLPLMLQDGCAAVVLKPTLVGGIEAAAGLATVARARGKRVVMTNAFESGVAHCHVTLWCGAFGGTGVAHGLNTYERLASDLLPTPFGELVERHLVSVERAQAALDELCDRELM